MKFLDSDPDYLENLLDSSIFQGLLNSQKCQKKSIHKFLNTVILLTTRQKNENNMDGRKHYLLFEEVNKIAYYNNEQ